MSHGAAAVPCCVRVIGTCVTCAGRAAMTRRGGLGGGGDHRKVCRGTCRDMGKLPCKPKAEPICDMCDEPIPRKRDAIALKPVSCDACRATYHLRCAKLARVPRHGSWICESCAMMPYSFFCMMLIRGNHNGSHSTSSYAGCHTQQSDISQLI